MTLLKRIVYWVFLILLTLFLGGALAVYVFKDRIIQQVITEVNEFLTTPVQVAKVDIDFFHGFPNVAVQFHEVFMESGFGETLLAAEEVYVLVSPFQLAKGNLDIEKIEIVSARLDLKIDKKGQPNFLVFKLQDTTVVKTDRADFNLQSIRFEDVNITYSDALTNVRYKFLVNELNGAIGQQDNLLTTSTKGSVVVKEINLRDFHYSLSDPLTLNVKTEYAIDTKTLSIKESKIITHDTELDLYGDIELADPTKIDLQLSTDRATFQLLTSLLPPNLGRYLADYKSKGNISLVARLAGEFSDEARPSLTSTFNLAGVELDHSELKADIKELHLAGKLNIGDIGNLNTGRLSVTKAQGLLMGEPFAFEASIRKFTSPDITFSFDGPISMEWLASTFQYERANSASGMINVNLNYIGSLNKDPAKTKETVDGTLSLDAVAIDLPNGTVLKNLKGDLAFSKGRIEVTNIAGFMGESDFLLNGNITGLQSLSGVRKQQEPVQLIADLKAADINLDEITETIIALADEPRQSSTAQFPTVDFTLNFIIKELKFKRFKGQEIVGELDYANNQLNVNHFSSKTMGGKVVVKGLLAQQQSGDYYIEAYAKTNNINLDSLFYVFNNFNQQFLTDKSLKGQLNAEIFTSMYFDKNWRLRRNLLKAETKLNVVNGELNNFKPLMALSKYLDDREDNLAELRFAELTNYINIANDTVFIPEMKVKTNVRDITVAGTHTLSQHINYSLSVPVINENIDKDEVFGAVQKVQGGSPNLLFRIKGTTTDYKVNYDLIKAVGGVFKLLNLKKTFQQREQELDSVTLDEEEFDWE